MARIFSRRFSASLRWLAGLDKEDVWIYVGGITLVGVAISLGYDDILTRFFLFLFACQMIYKVYRWIRPKKPTGTIEMPGINQMKGRPRVNGKKVH